MFNHHRYVLYCNNLSKNFKTSFSLITDDIEFILVIVNFRKLCVSKSKNFKGNKKLMVNFKLVQVQQFCCR